MPIRKQFIVIIILVIFKRKSYGFKVSRVITVSFLQIQYRINERIQRFLRQNELFAAGIDLLLFSFVSVFY